MIVIKKTTGGLLIDTGMQYLIPVTFAKKARQKLFNF